MRTSFKSALVIVAVIGSLAAGASSAIADGTGASTYSGGASGCCKVIN